MTVPALQALRRLVKKEGCVLLHRALAQVAGEVAKGLIDSLLKILSGSPAVFDSAILQLADATQVMKAFGHVCAILKLRQMVGQFTRIVPRAVMPHHDKDLVGHMKNAGIAGLIESPRVTELFGSLLASSYWEAFDYDVANNAMRDNSHLWAQFFDALAAFAVAAQSTLTPHIFYRQLFARCVNSINKGREVFGAKKKNYPGLQMLIVVDHMVSESQYADYSQLEALVPYQLIRSLYTAKLSIVGDPDTK
jgi:hypothetical protein